MQIVKIFLASSCELAEERKFIGNMIRELSDSWRINNVRFSLQIWEDFHPEYRGIRMQTEYDESLVKTANIVIGLFRDFCGKYTQEEIRIAKVCNAANLYVYRMPQVTADSAVSDFLRSEGITGIACNDNKTLWSGIKGILEDYANTNVDKVARTHGVSLRESLLYATFFPDMQSFDVSVGETIRSLSEILIEQNVADIHLSQVGQMGAIAGSEHYLAFMKDQSDATAEAEMSLAFAQNAASGQPVISPYLSVNGKIKENSKVVANLLNTTGAFTIDFANLDLLKLNLLLYYYKSQHFRTVRLEDGFIHLQQDDLYSNNRLLCSLDTIIKGNVLAKDFVQYKQTCEELEAIKDSNNLDNRKIQLIEKKTALYSLIQTSLSNLLTELMRNGSRLEERVDCSKPYDISIAKQTFEILEHRKRVAQEEMEAANEELHNILDELQARVDYLLLNTKKDTEKQELIKLVLFRRDLINDKAEEFRDKAPLLLDAKLDELRMYQVLNITSLNGISEDDLFGETYTLADKFGILCHDSELARFNYANMLSRQKQLPAALKLYEECANNLAVLYEKTKRNANLLSKALALCVHTASDMRDNEAIWKHFNKYSDFINQLTAREDKKEIHIKADYYSAFLKIAPDTVTIGLYPMLNAAIELYLVHVTMLNLPVSDEDYGLLYCYLPNNISTFFIDRYENSPHPWQYEAEGIRYADIMYANAQKLKMYDPLEGMNFMAMACHNKGYMLSKVKKYDDAIVAYNEALTLRRDIDNHLHTPSTQMEIAETLVNLASAKIEWCKLNKKMTNHDPMPNAREAYETLKPYKDSDTIGLRTNYYKGLQIYASVMYEFGKANKRKRALDMLTECLKWSLEHQGNGYDAQFLGTAGRILAEEGRVKIKNKNE